MSGHPEDAPGFDPAKAPYRAPKPPPPDMPVDPNKWRALPRKTRRALLRHHEKYGRG